MRNLALHISILFFINLARASSTVIYKKRTQQPTVNPSRRPTRPPSLDDPVLQSFTLDCNYGKLILNFDILVSAQTLTYIYSDAYPHIPLGIHLHDSVNDPVNSSLPLTNPFNDLSIQGNTTALEILLNSDDFARMKLSPTIAKSQFSTFLSINRGAVLSSIGYSNQEVSRHSSMMTSLYIADTSPPYVISFTLDMSTIPGELNITFSEPMNNITINLNGLSLQSVPACNVDSCKSVSLIEDGASLLLVSNLQRTVSFALGTLNMNKIKATLGLGVSLETSYLTGYSRGFASDVSGNRVSLVGFDKYNALKAKQYLYDTAPPVFLHWTFDVNSGVIQISFSETIYLSFFNYSGVTLLNSPNNSMYSLRISTPADLQTDNTDTVTFSLTNDQLNQIKAIDHFMKSTADSYLQLNDRIVVDTSLAQNIYRSNAASILKVSRFVKDTIRPTLLSFSLDLEARLLTLYFSETMKLNSLDLSQITLQSDYTQSLLTQYVTASATLATVLTTKDSDTIIISLSTRIFALIKQATNLCKSPSDCFIVASADFSKDKGFPKSNRLVEISSAAALIVSTYIPDLQRPYLMNWFADFNSNRVTLELSKPINVTSISPQFLILSSDSVIVRSSVVISVSNNSYVSAANLNEVTIQLSVNDIIAIKSQPALCSSKKNCFLSFNSSFANDTKTVLTTGESIQLSIKSTSYMSCRNVTFDITSPQIKSFNLDMNLRRLSLTFSEPVTCQDFNFTGISFSNSSSNIHSSVKLGSFSYTDSYNSIYCVVELSSTDYLNLRRNKYVAISDSKNFLYAEVFSVYDTAYNELSDTNELSSGNPIKCSSFTSTKSSPQLLSLYLQQSTKLLYVYFSDIIDISSVIVNNFFITTKNRDVTLQLSSCTITNSADDYFIVLNLSPMWNQLQSIGLIISQDTTFLYISGGFIHDITVPVSNIFTGVSIPNAIRDGYVIDSFQLDLTRSILILEFANVFQGVTITINDISLLTLYSSDLSNSYSLTGYSKIVVNPTENFVIIYLSNTDQFSIGSIFTLQSKASLLLKVDSNAFQDSQLKVLSKTFTLTCSYLVVDKSPLVVQSVVVDMIQGILKIKFSKDIIASLLNFENTIKLQSDQSDFSQSLVLQKLTLVKSVPNKLYLTDISVNLNNIWNNITTREQIIQYFPIASIAVNTYISISSGLAYDKQSPLTPSLAITSDNAFQVSTLVPDTVPPVVLYYDLDLNLKQMTLYFDEAVNGSSCVVEYITLLADPGYTSSTHYKLTSASYSITQGASHGKVDVDAIYFVAPRLALYKTETYICFKPGTFYDLAYPPNPNIEIFYRYAIPVNTYTPDSTPPKLVNYFFSIPNSTLDFYFDKLVNCSATKVKNIMFQYTSFLGSSTEFYRLTDNSVVVCNSSEVNDPHVRVDIGFDDLLNMRVFTYLIKQQNYTYLRLFSGAFTDTPGNENLNIPDGFAILPSQFYSDSVPPHLLAFSVFSVMRLLLYFDKPMDVTSIPVSQITLQDAYSTFQKTYTLSKATFFRVDRLLMIVEYQLFNDFYRITLDSQVLKLQSKTFLWINPKGIVDTFGNELIGINSTSAIRIGPSINYWDLDLNSGLIILHFTELVSTSFNLESFAIQSTYAYTEGATIILALTTQNYFKRLDTDESNTTLACVLSDYDLNRLKSSPLIYYHSNLFLTAAENVTKSIYGEDIIPDMISNELRNYSALAMRRLFVDTTPPNCLTYVLDLKLGILSLHFDEPVNIASLVVEGITLLSNYTGSFATLATSTNMTLLYLTKLYIYLSTSDLNNIKIATKTGIVLNNLVIKSHSVRDLFGNSIIGNIANNPILIDEFIPDNVAPFAKSFTVDLTTFIFSLTFNELIDVASIFGTDILLLSSNNMTSAQSLQLSNYSLISSVKNVVYIDLDFHSVDSLALDAKNLIANNISDSFIAIKNFRDIFGNVHNNYQILQASQFIYNLQFVKLESFDFITVSSIVTVQLYFSRLIEISSFNLSDFKFLVDSSGSNSVGFTNAQCTINTNHNSNSISISINANLFTQSIGSDVSKTWISIAKSVTNTIDIYGNTIYPKGGAIRVGPRVRKFSFDVNSGVIILDFPTIVVTESFVNISFIGLYSSISSKTFYLQQESQQTYLKGVTNTSIVIFQLDQWNINNIKLLDIDSKSLYLICRGSNFTSSLVDARGISLSPIDLNNNLAVSRFLPDTQSPFILNITLNLADEYLQILFNEPIRLDSVVLTNIRLQNNQYDANDFLILSGGNLQLDYTTVTISLLKNDSALLKLKTTLAKRLNDSYFSIQYKSMTDYAGNYLNSISLNNARPIDIVIVDNVRPLLDYFILDLSSGYTAILSLFFSEPVQSTSFQVTEITFQNRFYSNQSFAHSYKLTGGKILSPDSNSIVIQLLASDITTMEKIPGLIRNIYTTYIVTTQYLTSDLVGNQVVPFLDGAALTCRKYIPDLTSPIILNSLLNLNKEFIQFSMSKPVNLTYLILPSLTIKVNSNSYSLAAGISVVTQAIPFDTTVIINLAPIDLDSIKNLLIKQGNDTVQFLYKPTLIRDSFNNLMGTGSSVFDAIVRDVTKPALVKYLQDMNSLTITLIFTEAMSLQSMNLLEIILQNTQTRRVGDYIALNGSTVTVSLTNVYIDLPTSTGNYLKYYKIGSSIAFTFLSWSDVFMSDFSGNYPNPYWDASVYNYSPISPNSLTSDSTSPFLLKWYIDRTKNIAHFQFNEPVVVTNLTQLTFSTPYFINSLNYTFFTKSLNTDLRLLLFCLDNTCPSPSIPIFVSLSMNSFSDFMDNSINPISMVETGPDCSECPSGQYTITNCTVSSDRVCHPCSSCSPGQFRYSSCSSYRDTQCDICSDCGFERYISTSCQPDKDTQCEKCITCNQMQYVTKECLNGNNRECGSCKSCVFLTNEIRLQCESPPASKYASWARINCCKDMNGNRVNCDDVERINMVSLVKSGNMKANLV